jgi:hypothetical protein
MCSVHCSGDGVSQTKAIARQSPEQLAGKLFQQSAPSNPSANEFDE